MLRRMWILLLLVVVPVVRAQSNTSWTALIHESNGGTLTKIDAQGVILREIALPIKSGMTVHGLRAAASPDGAYVAYTLADNADGNVSRVQLNLYDLSDERVFSAYTLPEGVDINSFNQFSLNLKPRLGGGAIASGYGYFVEDDLFWEIVSISDEVWKRIHADQQRSGYAWR